MKFMSIFTGTALFFAALGSQAGDYSNHPDAKSFIAYMVKTHKFKEEYLQGVLDQAEKKQSILDAIAKPAEKTKPWYEYRKIFLGKERIEQGVEFWQAHENTLTQVSEQYGVEPEIIVAIIGVETRYGRYMGSHRVLDALATLGFDYPPRSKFFTSQLEHFFLLVREQKQEPTELFGSYAGAMGFGQFIPSSYRRYARDFDNDGYADIWQNKSDAIASVANYFKAHGWQSKAPVFAPASVDESAEKLTINPGKRPSTTVKLWRDQGVKIETSANDDAKAVLLEYEFENGPEYKLGFNNFYVITRYNRSHMYALAVWELSQAILELKNSKELKPDI